MSTAQNKGAIVPLRTKGTPALCVYFVAGEHEIKINNSTRLQKSAAMLNKTKKIFNFPAYYVRVVIKMVYFVTK